MPEDFYVIGNINIRKLQCHIIGGRKFLNHGKVKYSEDLVPGNVKAY